MESHGLRTKKCKPCEGGVLPLSPEEVKHYLSEVPEWEATEDVGKIYRSFKFKNFREAVAFVNRIAELAEEEDHHPDISIYYSKVDLELSTHAINGLSENDFILAAKIDALL